MSALKKEVFLQNLPEVDFREKGLFSVGSVMSKGVGLLEKLAHDARVRLCKTQKTLRICLKTSPLCGRGF